MLKRSLVLTTSYFNVVYPCMQEENRIAREVVDAALKLHRHFGPGVYESVYEPVLVYELNKRSPRTRQQTDRKSTRLNSSHSEISRMPSSA